MDGDPPVARDLVDPLLQMTERDIDTAGDPTGGPLARCPDIQDHGRIRSGKLLGGHPGADALCLRQQFGTPGQRFDAAVQITLDVIEADPAQPYRGFLLALWRRNDHNRQCAVEDGAGPGGELPSEADI